MSKHTQKMYVFLEKRWNDDYSVEFWAPALWSFKIEDTDKRVFVCETTSEFEMPDGFDPIQKQLAALEAAKSEALRQYQERVAELNTRISKLQAITYEES